MLLRKLFAMVALGVAMNAPAQQAAVQQAAAQQTPPPDAQTGIQTGIQPGIQTLRANTSLVLVPALVTTKDAKPVFTLTESDFTLTDDGVPQTLRLEEDADRQPIALVVLVEAGGDGIKHLPDYRDLQTAIENVIGGVEHIVALVDFDSEPELYLPFTPDTDKLGRALRKLDAGDDGDALLDGLNFSVDLLRKQPPRYRRAILMFTETHDRGSNTSLEQAVRAVSDTNTAIYSFGFSSVRNSVKRAAGPLPAGLGGSSAPNPDHGCFSRAPDANGNAPTKSVASQDYDCVAQLLPPLALARALLTAAIGAMEKDIPETVAKLTGGEYFSFKDERGLERGLHELSNHVPNRYVLSFTPQQPHPGLHALVLKLNDRPNLKLDARTSYWAEEPAK